MTWTSEEILKAIGQYAPDECITEKRLVELTPYADRQVENALKRLMEHGFIERTAPGCFQLTDAGRIALESGTRIRSGTRNMKKVRVHKDSLRTKVWRAFRNRRKLSVPEIEQLVCTGEEKNARNNIHHYIKLLEEAGYIVKMKKKLAGTSPTSNGFARWLLLDEKNTGPLAPVYRAAKMAIYDPNTEEETPLCG